MSRAVSNAAWAARNPEKMRVYKRRYREANREKLRAQGRAYATRWRALNPEKIKAQNAAQYAKDPEGRCVAARAYHRKRKYGLTTADIEQRLAANDQCSGCGTHLNLHTACVDHCHKTGVIRGLLCGRCNLALGHVADDPFILRRLAAYLEKSNG